MSVSMLGSSLGPIASAPHSNFCNVSLFTLYSNSCHGGSYNRGIAVVQCNVTAHIAGTILTPWTTFLFNTSSSLKNVEGWLDENEDILKKILLNILFTTAALQRNINIYYYQDKIRGSNPLVLKKMCWNQNWIGESTAEWPESKLDLLHTTSLMTC